MTKTVNAMKILTKNRCRNSFVAATAMALLKIASPAGAIAAEEPAKPQTAAPAPSILVAAALKREIVETLAVNGSVVPREEVSAGADVTGLMVVDLLADQGDSVKKGQVLARLDRAALEVQLAQIAAQRSQSKATVAQAEAQIAEAEVGVRQALEAWERARALKAKGVATAAQYDDSVNAHDSAKARLRTASMAKAASEAQLALIDAQERDVLLRLSKTEVLAPADGVVLARNAQLGGIVSAQAGPLFRIAKGNEFELAANVPEAELARLAVDMPVAVTLPGTTQPVAGKIRLLSPEVDTRSRLGSIRVALPADAKARAGAFGSGSVELLRRNAVAIPVGALMYRDGIAYLQTVRDDRIASREVTLGARANGYVEISQGVAEGDVFVLRAGTFVADGDRIRPVREEDKTGAISQ